MSIMSQQDDIGELEIVAGPVWNAVGGYIEDGISGDPSDEVGARVSVRRIDPKKFGVESAAGTSQSWAPGEEGQPRNVVLQVIRPFKVMDMQTFTIVDDGTSITYGTGLVVMTNLDISGKQQFTSNNPMPADAFSFGLLSRPKIRLDTVQTDIPLNLAVTYAGHAIPVGTTVFFSVVFSGVALKTG